MKVNSLANLSQTSKKIEGDKEKFKAKNQPIMPYYIMTNRIYSNYDNSPKKIKELLTKKNNINKLKDININIKNKKNKIIKIIRLYHLIILFIIIII